MASTSARPKVSREACEGARSPPSFFVKPTCLDADRYVRLRTVYGRNQLLDIATCHYPPTRNKVLAGGGDWQRLEGQAFGGALCCRCPAGFCQAMDCEQPVCPGGAYLAYSRSTNRAGIIRAAGLAAVKLFLCLFF